MAIAPNRARLQLIQFVNWLRILLPRFFRFATNIRHPGQRARASRLRIAPPCQSPPLAVRTPRSFNAWAMARWVVASAAQSERPPLTCSAVETQQYPVRLIIAPNLRELANDLELSLSGSSRTSRACLVPGANLRLLVTQCSAEVDFRHSRR